MKGKTKYSTKADDLQFGEAYRTTKAHIWSIFNKTFDKIDVPEDTLLIFRSFLQKKGGIRIARFVWLEKNETICLSVSKEHCVLYVTHVDWERRHFSIRSNKLSPSKKKITKVN